ncbi:hypothetical protein MSPP1_004089 [Malassezia sp. CBS 17886]|nr:hypothetical protein MSPP1_004089 [Malassezia sp. CBS 17886]
MAQILTSPIAHPNTKYPTGNLYEFITSNPYKSQPADVASWRLDGKPMTRGDVEHTAKQIAYFLRHTLGLAAGQRVAVVSPNSTLYLPVVLGIARAGLVCVATNPVYSTDEMVHPFLDSDVAVALVFPAIVPAVRAAFEKAQRPQHLANGQRAIWLMDEADTVPALPTGETDFRPALSSDDWPIEQIRDPRSTEVVIAYSSGTSGKPKGVLLTHDNLVCGCDGLCEGSKGDVGPHQIAISVLPMFHIFGLNILVFSAFLVSMRAVVVPRFDVDVFCAAVQRFHVTLAAVVPPMLLALARHPSVAKYDLSSLRVALCGAAPLGVELGDEVENRLPHLRVCQGYGLSETSPVVAFAPSADYRNHKGSCGFPFPGTEVRLIDADDKDVAHDQGSDGKPGELWVRGRMVMKGYQNNKEATDESLTPDGWYKTGDIAIYKDGFLYIVDRKKELIKYKGFQVAPAELEALLLANSSVADVAVIGMYDKAQATELPCAFVQPRPGTLDVNKATPEEKEKLAKAIIDWTAERVANHKKLRGGVIFIPEVPKSASGKILRRLLRDKYASA